jgi:hypothetical protein
MARSHTGSCLLGQISGRIWPTEPDLTDLVGYSSTTRLEKSMAPTAFRHASLEFRVFTHAGARYILKNSTLSLRAMLRTTAVLEYSPRVFQVNSVSNDRTTTAVASFCMQPRALLQNSTKTKLACSSSELDPGIEPENRPAAPCCCMRRSNLRDRASELDPGIEPENRRPAA